MKISPARTTKKNPKKRKLLVSNLCPSKSKSFEGLNPFLYMAILLIILYCIDKIQKQICQDRGLPIILFDGLSDSTKESKVKLSLGVSMIG